MSDREEGYPFFDRHQETPSPTERCRNGNSAILCRLPLVEESEQRIELKDRDTVQIYYVFLLGPFIVAVADVAAAGLLSKYISEHGGVSEQEVLMYSETSIFHLSNRHGKSLSFEVDDPTCDILER
jgi:hypothetical protein